MYKKILVPLDGSELAECILPHLESISQGCGTGEVVFIRAVEPVYLPSTGMGDSPVVTREQAEKARKEIEARNAAEAREYLSGIVKKVKIGGARAKAEVLMGKAAETLSSYATKNGIDLIIISTHGRSGVSRWIWGSVADRVLRSACVPVLMVRAPGCVVGI